MPGVSSAGPGTGKAFNFTHIVRHLEVLKGFVVFKDPFGPALLAISHAAGRDGDTSAAFEEMVDLSATDQPRMTCRAYIGYQCLPSSAIRPAPDHSGRGRLLREHAGLVAGYAPWRP